MSATSGKSAPESGSGQQSRMSGFAPGSPGTGGPSKRGVKGEPRSVEEAFGIIRTGRTPMDGDPRPE